MRVLADVEHRYGPEPRQRARSRRLGRQLGNDSGRVVDDGGAKLRILSKISKLRHPNQARGLVRVGSRGEGRTHPRYQHLEVVAKPSQVGRRAWPEVARDDHLGVQPAQRIEHRDPMSREPFTHGGTSPVHEDIARGEDSLGCFPHDEVSRGVRQAGMEHLDDLPTEVKASPVSDDRIGDRGAAIRQFSAIAGQLGLGRECSGHPGSPFGQGSPGLPVGKDGEPSLAGAQDA